MTNWDKIEPTLRKLVPGITRETFSMVLEDRMSFLNEGKYSCRKGCTAYNECFSNDKTCWQNLNDWLGQEATDE